ncbi:MAG TPA: S49 family peptidase, partial [Kofleriaceae bacterium]|nr:S49 family peptidase [Kofleriaceae bacterium]
MESRRLAIHTTSGAQVSSDDGRDVRLALGLELSLGAFGATSWVSGLRDERGDSSLLGSGILLRSSAVEVPSLLAPDDHIERISLGGSLDGPALVALVLRLRAIGRDRSAKAVALVFEDLSAGWATVREVRQELASLRASGKKIYAFLISGDTRDYYLASVAHKIYVDPAGGLSLTGLRSLTMYWRGAFDLVGISPEFEKIAEYKSAPEQLTRDGPSVPASRMRAELADGLWDEVRAAIAQSRGLTLERVQELIDAGPYTAGDLATSTALVDAVATPERAAVAITEDLGLAIGVDEPPVERPGKWRRPRIALVHLQGDIVDGASQSVPLLGRRMAGGETIAAAIAAARAAPDI